MNIKQNQIKKMTKIKSLFLTALMLAAVLTAGAVVDDPGLLVKNVNNRPGVYKVTFYGGDSGVVTLTVYSSKGKPLFQETLRDSKEFIRLVNLENLGADSYTIEVKDGKNKVEAKVEYTL
jgi:inosine/xanthosine triphosphate pyrophosphatase family protein